MAVINYKDHIFISYAHADDYDLGDGLSWIGNFYDLLNRHFRGPAGAGQELKVWRDNDRLRPADILGKSIEEGLKNAAIFVPVISSTYLAQEWCRKEFLTFCRLHKETLVIGNKLRIVPIILNNPDPKEGLHGIKPKLIDNAEIDDILALLTGDLEPFYKSFHDEDGMTINRNSAAQEYDEVSIHTAKALLQILQEIMGHNKVAQELEKMDDEFKKRKSLFVSLPEKSNLKAWEDRVRFIEELRDFFNRKKLDYQIVPSVEKGDDELGQDVIDDLLENSIGYIQLFSQSSDLISHQFNKAVQLTGKIKGLVLCDVSDKQKEAIRQIEGPKPSIHHTRLKFKKISLLCDLIKTEIIDSAEKNHGLLKIEKEKKVSPKKRIFFWHGSSKDDEARIRKKIEKQLIIDPQLEVIPNITGELTLDLMEYEEKSLKRSDGVLMYQGSASENWCIMRMDAIRDQGKHKRSGVVVRHDKIPTRILGLSGFCFIPNKDVLIQMEEWTKKEMEDYEKLIIEEVNNFREVITSSAT